MTVIYLDTLFFLNALMDYLLLLCSARIAGEELHRLRIALGALLGGAYAAAAVLPGMEFLLQPVFKAGSAVLMVVVGLGASRRLLRQAVIFFALACAFGGGVLAVSLFGGTGLSLGGGLVYSGMDIKIVLLSAAGCAGIVLQIRYLELRAAVGALVCSAYTSPQSGGAAHCRGGGVGTCTAAPY